MVPPTVNGGAEAGNNLSLNEDHIRQFWKRHEATKMNDEVKNMLLEDVLHRYEYLLRKHEDYVAEHERDHEQAKQAIQQQEAAWDNCLRLQRILNRDPFILLLIDGDGMAFSDKLLSQGEVGGQQAATLLQNAVIEWATSAVMECPSNVKIVARVYANLEGLGQTCARAGIINAAERVAEFARGFTRGRMLFDFTDVGHGKDRADAKIIETLKLYLYDYHCRQILLGCSYDNSFARALEDYVGDDEVIGRLTLLESPPFDKELQARPFRTTKLPGIFRDSKILSSHGQDLITGHRGRVDSRNALSATSGVFTPRTGTPSSVYGPPHDVSQGQNTTALSSPAGMTWASITTKNAHKPLQDITRTAALPPEPKDAIQRNKHGQRLDKELNYDRDEVQRIKKLKSCNQHYIGIGCCHYNAGKEDKCPHSHHYDFSAQDLKTLRVVARETPCKRGHECDDPKCIYGHHCPFPAQTEGSLRGIWCLNGENCRFPRSMHNMDLAPAKMTRVAGAF